jgi:probable F420-dependent oxidoreductase
MHMKIGVGAFIDESTQAPDAIGRLCEQLGFESIWLPEHPVMPVATRPPQTSVSDRVFENQQVPDWYTRIPDPFITLMAVAAATTRLKLGTGVCLVPEHEPITLAKTIATLDLFSGGRFLFGIGAGGIREESEAMGVDFRRRWAMTREYIRAMKELWTKTESRFEGEFVKFPLLKSMPKPLQKPHPPIHIGAGGIGPNSTRALKDTAAMGDGWAPVAVPPNQLKKDLAELKELCAQSGRDFSRIEITIFMPIETGEPRDTIRAYEEAGAHRLVFTLFAPQLTQAGLENLARRYLQS